MPAGRDLRIELPSAALIHGSEDGWRTVFDTPTEDSSFGIHFVDLRTADLKADGEIVFTIYWPAEDRWEGVDYRISLSSDIEPKTETSTTTELPVHARS